MLEVTRIYLNGEDQLRIDTIIMQRKDNTSTIGIEKPVFERNIIKMVLFTNIDREVDSIQLIGTFTDQEDESGDYTWCSWDKPACICYMDDLPGVGDDV
jgi:hypothetical protein